MKLDWDIINVPEKRLRQNVYLCKNYFYLDFWIVVIILTHALLRIFFKLYIQSI